MEVLPEFREYISSLETIPGMLLESLWWNAKALYAPRELTEINA